ncbi:hypothetical protein D3C87_84790 [compost metagenome]
MNKGLYIYFTIALFLASSFIIKYTKNKNIEEGSNTILWSSNRKLTWNDFQGIADSTSKYKAHTYSQITTTLIYYNNDSIVYDMPCHFIVNKSWATNIKTDALLKHEQLHFDIAELCARKIRREYINHKMVDTKKTYKFISDIFEKYGKKNQNSLNNFYDLETKHGLIKDKQKEWEAKIAKELKALEKYANTRVVINRIKK